MGMFMKDIAEISKPTVQPDWRGIRIFEVNIFYNSECPCDMCELSSHCDYKKYKPQYTAVLYRLSNRNSFPIYSDFVDSTTAIDENSVQHDTASNTRLSCLTAMTRKHGVYNLGSIMPGATQNRLVLYSKNVKSIASLAYRGTIYTKYGECNWGYFSYNVKTGELLTNGSLENIKQIEAEYEKRKKEKLYVKPYKLISDLEVITYKRNELPQTFKDFTSLTTKAKGLIKELEELNKRDNLELDAEIEKYRTAVGDKTYSENTVFLKAENIRIKKLYEEITPEEFEHYVASQFSEKGYSVEVTRYSGDEGIDILMSKKGKLYGVQCKMLDESRFVDTVDMLNFLGALVNIRADGGFFVTTGKITQKGYDIALRNGITVVTI